MRIKQAVRDGVDASGAVTAQLVQALTSFGLQLVAARALGMEGLGVFALLYSGLVLGTALATGMVGDSLTVLDRQSAPVRSGLQVVGSVVAALVAVVGAALSAAAGLLTPGAAVLFGVVVAVFVVEELFRRLLMSGLHFWQVVVVDATALVTTATFLGGTIVVTGTVELTDLLWALLLAQGLGLVTAIAVLPKDERWLAPLRGAHVVAVVQFGSWRSAQQGIRPATLLAIRSIVVLASGTAAFGALEAARILTAPAMLLVNGFASFLLASNAASSRERTRSAVRAADVRGGSLCVAILVGGLVAVTLLPRIGPFVTDGSYDLDGIAVFGWAAYAASAALLMPYASIAVVSGLHVMVFKQRLLDPLISVSAVTVVLFSFGVSEVWVPLLLAAATTAIAVLMRRKLLIPAADTALREAST